LIQQKLIHTLKNCLTVSEFCRRGGSNESPSYVAVAPLPPASPAPSGKPGPGAVSGRDYRFLLLGGILAVVTNVFLAWASHLPLWQRIVRRFIWWGSKAPPSDPYGPYTGAATWRFWDQIPLLHEGHAMASCTVPGIFSLCDGHIMTLGKRGNKC
jgi:hypothetical protein